MANTTHEQQAGDTLHVATLEVAEELGRSLKEQSRLQDDLDSSSDALTAATKDFTDCWAAHEATGVGLCNAFREVTNRRAAHDELCVDAKKALQRTLEAKRKATEIQEDVAIHRERTRRVTNEHARAEDHVNDGRGSLGKALQAAGCAGQAGERSISLHPSENGRCSQIVENSKIGVSRHLDSSTTHKWPKSWSSMEDPVVPLERNLYGHPLAGLLWERQFEKILLKHGWEKIPNWECLFVHREKGLFLSVYVDDIKLAGKKQNLDPMWKVLNKEVDLGEPTSFLDHVYLGCTQNCGQLQNHV